GYFTIASSLTDFWRSAGGWSVGDLRALTNDDVASVLGQDAGHELMGLYAEALQDLGRFLGGRRGLEVVEEAGGSAERLPGPPRGGSPFFSRRCVSAPRHSHA